MRIDKTQEKLSISEIIAGLDDFERIVFSKAEIQKHKAGLLALKVACQTFKELNESPLPIFYSVPRVKECCIHVAASMDLVRHFKKTEKKSELKVLKKHLKLVGAGGYGIGATYVNQQSKYSFIQEKIKEAGIQQLPAEILKDCSRKTIELMVGLAALNAFDEVLLEDPEKSSVKNPNPDILIRKGKEKYGIACKSLTSKNKTNFRERITEALGQIDRAIRVGKIDKRRGMVLIDISALLDHDELYSPWRGA